MGAPRPAALTAAALSLALGCAPALAQTREPPRRGAVRTPIPGSTTRTADPADEKQTPPGDPARQPAGSPGSGGRVPAAATYADLAREIADTHWIHGEGPPTVTPVDLGAWADALAASPVAAVREAAAELRAGRDRARAAEARVLGIVDAAGENLDAALEGALRGDYTVTHERVSITTDRYGQPQARTDSYTEDASALPVLGSAALYWWVRSSAPAAAQRQAMMHLEVARGRAWTAVMRHIGDVYAAAPAATALADLSLTQNADGSCTFTAVNTSGKTLRRVTLAVELYHFTTTPYPTVQRFHFLDQWAPNQRIAFSPDFVPNVGSPATRNGRPTITSPKTSADPADRLLVGMAGVTRVAWRVWSDQGIASAQELARPEAAARAARWELQCAHRFLLADRGDPDRIDPRTGRQLPTRRTGPEPLIPPERPESTQASPRAREFAERVLALAQPDSPEATQAALLLKNPHQALRAQRQKQVESFLAAIPVGAVFEGTWTLPPGVLPKANAPLVNNDPHPKPETGRFRLRVLRSGPADDAVAVLIEHPDDRRLRRNMVGELAIVYNQMRLRLAPPGDAANARLRPIESAEKSFFEDGFTLVLEPVEGGFHGAMEHLRGPVFRVTLTRIVQGR